MNYDVTLFASGGRNEETSVTLYAHAATLRIAGPFGAVMIDSRTPDGLLEIAQVILAACAPIPAEPPAPEPEELHCEPAAVPADGGPF